MAHIRPLGDGFHAECYDLPVAVQAPSLDAVVSQVREDLRTYLADGRRADLSGAEPPLILFALQFAPYTSSEY